MSTADNDNNNKDDIPNICANCGKGEDSSSSLKACTACKLVKYCNRECQIAHRPQHKKECKKRAAELHDDLLFKQPPPEYGDCPICFLRMPTLISGSAYMPCCGKVICCGCAYAPVYDNEGNVITEETCSFCRTPPPISDEETVKRMKKRVEADDPIAIYNLGGYYCAGANGLPQDYAKALELWHRAGEVGDVAAYHQIGCMYDNGDGVKQNEKKAVHYYEIAAMRGHTMARHNLGYTELVEYGNKDRALKHYMIAVNGGCNASLKNIRKMVTKGLATKEDYSKALQSYQKYLDETKSDQRDKAAAADETCKYTD